MPSANANHSQQRIAPTKVVSPQTIATYRVVAIDNHSQVVGMVRGCNRGETCNRGRFIIFLDPTPTPPLGVPLALYL
jgi:hypothetical protein